MPYLFDTNTLVRLAESESEHRSSVLQSIRKLRDRREIICITPQIVSEFWNVCTRPISSRGGLGLSVELTERKVAIIEKYFTLLPDNLSTFVEWRHLVSSEKILGVQVHDAKIVASMKVYGVENLVTFNKKDFVRFPAITILSPTDL